MDWLSNLISSMSTGIGEIGSNIGSGLSDIGSSLLGGLSGTTSDATANLVGQVGSGVGSAVAPTTQGLTNELLGLQIGAIKDAGKSSWTDLLAPLSSLGSSIYSGNIQKNAYEDQAKLQNRQQDLSESQIARSNALDDQDKAARANSARGYNSGGTSTLSQEEIYRLSGQGAIDEQKRNAALYG